MFSEIYQLLISADNFSDAVHALITGDDEDVFVIEGLYLMALQNHHWENAKTLMTYGLADNELQEADTGSIYRAMKACGDEPDIVNWLAANGADVNRREINDWTPLHIAAVSNYSGCCKALLKLGADVNARTRIDDRTLPIEDAASQNAIAAVIVLLEAGAMPGAAAKYAVDRGHREFL